MSTKNMKSQARLRLIRKVYNTCSDHTESFEVQHIGADLAYLLGAIAKDTECEWDINRPIVRLLKAHLPLPSPVWDFIELSEGDDLGFYKDIEPLPE